MESIGALSLQAKLPIHNPQPNTTIQHFSISTLGPAFDANAAWASAELSTRRVGVQATESNVANG
jgi:hypothetical protein